MELYWAALFALEFRQKFGRDIVIDMYCYRRQGHNEADQAAFTQPVIARKIADRPTFGKIYKQQLVDEGVISQDDVDALEQGDLGQAGRRAIRKCSTCTRPATARPSAAPPASSSRSIPTRRCATGIEPRHAPAHRPGAHHRSRTTST